MRPPPGVANEGAEPAADPGDRARTNACAWRGPRELAGFYRETVAFLDALAQGHAPSPSLRESRQSVEIAERIRQRAADYRA